MSYEIVANQELIKWCDEQTEMGNKLAIRWEGGGDSGWAYFTINGEQVDHVKETDHITKLLDLMYDCLDYGSWAGEFSADGEATYDPKQKAFVGVDYYCEDDDYNWKCQIEIRVPKSLWFDSLEYMIEDEDVKVSTAFTVRNGFLTPEHEIVTEILNEKLAEAVQEEITKFQDAPGTPEYRSMWEDDAITRSLFKEDGDDLVYILDEINIGTYESQEKDIVLQLQPEEYED